MDLPPPFMNGAFIAFGRLVEAALGTDRPRATGRGVGTDIEAPAALDFRFAIIHLP